MHKADQFVAVQNHSTAAGLPLQHVFNVIFKRVVVVFERDELVAVRMGEHAKRSGKVAGKLQHPLTFFGANQDANHGGK
jgi:uncharacterized membrane protein